MHTKKVKWIRNALLFLLLLGLTSCLEVKQSININKDGSGDAKMEIGIQQEWAAQIVPKLKSDIPKGWKLIEEKEKDGKQVLAIGRDFKTVSELNDDEFRYSFSMERKGLFKNSYSLEITQLKSSEAPFPFETVVKMPGSVDETNGSKMASGEVKWNSQGLRRGNALSVKSSGFALPEFASLKDSFNKTFDSVFYREAIVFLRDSNIWIMDSDGTNQRQMPDTNFSSDGYPVSVSRKSQIVFKRGGNIYLADVNNGEIKQLTRDGNNLDPKISANGMTVLFSKVKLVNNDVVQRVWALNLIDGKETELSQGDEYFLSPDGARAVISKGQMEYGQMRTVTGAVVPTGIMKIFSNIVTIKDKNIVTLSDNLSSPMDICGDRIIMSDCRFRKTFSLYDTTTGKSNLIADNACVESARFLPDGKSIVFAARDPNGQNTTLWLVNSEGKKKIQTPSLSGNFSFSPDGEQLALASARDIWLADLKSSKTTKLAENASLSGWTTAPRFTLISASSAKTIIVVTMAIVSILLLFGMILIARKMISTSAHEHRPTGKIQEGNIFCSQCGTPNPASASFCKKCGAKVG